MKTSRDCRRGWIAWVLSVCLGLCFLAPPAGVSAQDKDKPKPAEKKVTFEVRDKPWRAVLEWLSDVTGLPFIGSPPTGTFTFVPPAKKQYTLDEVLAILNEGLQAQKKVLVRRENSLVLVPAEEKFDPSLLPRARPGWWVTPGKAEDATMRVFTLERGSAATLAEALRHLLAQTRSNPVQVVRPARVPGEVTKPEPPKKAEPAKMDAKPGKPDVPIILTPVSNRLIVSSVDPEALARAGELVRLLQAPAAEGDFEVIRLQHARAEHVARILDELFNGARQGGGGFRGTTGTGLGLARPENVRVIADPVTNSLLIKAGPLDLFTIRHLLKTALDTDPTEDRAAVRTWVIGPLKYAKAVEVAATIKPLYRERQWAVGVDDRTNTLVLACPEAVYQDIRRLVEQLEQITKDAAADGKSGTKKGEKK